jgi:putative ATP-dependent endonuclease of OLD family
MTVIRIVEISHFRGIEKLIWYPTAGINCLIGPGDSCKTTVLDAVDLCLGARRTATFSDADFLGLDVDTPISIACTLGSLSDRLKNIESYGLYLRSFDATSKEIDDEPKRGSETVLTVKLTVNSDLEPVWSLVSSRSEEMQQSRNLAWADRQVLSPTRIGAYADSNMAWRRGSVLNKLSDDRADVQAALARAAREARNVFGNAADAKLESTLEIVDEVAQELGIPVQGETRALLDAHSVSFSGGTISLHGGDGVPLRNLGTGSTRLLVAGLQREASKEASIVIVDELEHGLEPHRIHRLLDSLGAKSKIPPLQALMTTHSPVALRELSGDQLFVTRKANGQVSLLPVGRDDDVQSTIRSNPEAFLATKVIVCEGASEVGLIRGIDQYRVSRGYRSIWSCGVSLVDAGGVDKIYKRAQSLLNLGYKVIVLRDDDKQPDVDDEDTFELVGGSVLKWENGRKLEQELFQSLPFDDVLKLLQLAEGLHGEEWVNEHLKSVSRNRYTSSSITMDHMMGDLDESDCRKVLGDASSRRGSGWFKSVSWMEEAVSTIVGPAIPNCSQSLRAVISRIVKWSEDGG